MTRPSWQDFGTYDESEHARLWDGVVGAWCPSLGPTGSRLFDHSRFNNWGDLTNMTLASDWLLSNGQFALNFASTRKVQTSRAIVAATQAWTMSAWVYPTGTTGYRTICGNYGAGNTTGLQMNLWPSAGAVPANAPTVYYGASAINATSGIAANQWSHIAATRSGNAVTIFANGVQVGSGTNTGSVGTSRNWAIGQGPDYNDEPMIGYIDDHSVYNRALTANEVRDLYLLGRGGMFERRRRSRRRAIEQAAGFRAYWVGRNTVIGSGVY